MKHRCEKGIIIAGHRGNPKDWPENTLPSFQSAMELGVDMIETDIHLTADGVPVLIHDHDCKRTTDREGLVRDMTFEQLRTVNTGTADTFLRIPTLRELLELASQTDDLLLNLEIKVYRNDEGEHRVAEVIDQTVRLCEEFHMEQRILFNSFDAFVLETVFRTCGKRFPLHGFYPFDLMMNRTLDPLTYLDYACYWKHPDAKAYCDFLLANGIAPCTGTSASEADFVEAAQMGCSMFTDNDPRSALAWRARL